MVGSDTEATVMLNVVPGMNTGITAFNAGLSSINAQFQNVTDTIGRTFGMMDAMLVSSGAMIAQFGMGAASAYGEFEQGMQIVKAVSQQSGQAIAFLKQEAQDFAVQYRTGIDSITEGLQTLGRAGLNSAQEQTEVLEQGLQTAKLEGRELNGVLEEIIQNTALLGGDVKSDQFGEQAEYLNNLLVGTSLSAPIDTHDISETLKYSGGMVAAAGGTIATDEGYANEQGREIVEDYMGAIAAFGQKGVKGSIAGTALRAFFNKPASQDESVVDALNQIGLAPEDLWNDEETMKPISEQIELIQTQMKVKNVSRMDQMQLWSKIVGGKMGQQMMKLDAQDIREMTTDIQDASSARELSEQTFNTYNQKMNKLSEEGQKTFRDFGQHIVVALRPALEILDKFAQILNSPLLSGPVTFAGFAVFIATLSHSLRAALRVARQLRQELSMLLGGGGKPDFNAQQLLNNAHKGKWGAGYLDIRRPSDVMNQISEKTSVSGLSTSDKKKRKKQEYFSTMKSSISDIKQQMSDMIESTQQQFDNFDVDIDVNLDDIKQEIQSISTEAVKVINQITQEANQSAQQVKKNVQEVKQTIATPVSSGSRYETAQTPEKVSMSEIIANRKEYTKDKLADMIIQSGSEMSKKDLMKMKKAELAELAYPIINRDPNMDFINFQMKMKKDFPDMPHQWVMDEDGGYFNLAEGWRYNEKTGKYEQTGVNQWDKDYRQKQQEKDEADRKKAEKALKEQSDGAQEAYEMHKAIDEQDASGKYNKDNIKYSSSKEMDDFIKFQLRQKEMFPDMPHEWVMDKNGGYVNLREDEWTEEARAKAAADAAEMERKAKEVLDVLFAEAKEAAATAAAEKEAELMGQPYWDGMTEEEFNREYYRKHKKPWEIKEDDINWHKKADKESGINYINEFNDRKGDLVAKRDSKGNFLGYGPKEEYNLTGGDVSGLNSLFGVEEDPSRWQVYQNRGRAFRDALNNPDSDFSKNHETISKTYRKLGQKTDGLSKRFDGLAKSLGSTSTSTLGKAVDILGGPFSTAIIGATAAMELYNYAFGQWQKSVQEHQTKYSEAQNAVSEAEGKIREEYLTENPRASPSDANEAITDAYLEIGKNEGNINSLDENTKALYIATAQVQRASNLLEGDAMDGNFGMGGYFTRLTDDLQGAFDLLTGNYGTNLVMDSGEFASIFDNSGVSVSKGSITDNSNEAILKASQSSEDYIYSKENAAIFAADVWNALDQKKDIYGSYGMGTYFGSDSAHFQEVSRSIFGGNTGFGNSYYTNVIDMLGKNFQSDDSQHQLQMFLKNNKKDAQKLGKEIRKFEKANKGRSPISYFTDRKGGRVSQDKALKNLEVKDKDLVKYLRSLSIKTGMSAQQLLMASQLQQMQDLNQIMSEQLQPQVLGLAQSAYQQLSVQHGIGSNTGNTSSGAWSTYSAASAIAAKLNVLVEQALDTEMQQDYINAGGDNKAYIDNPQQLKADMVKAYNTPPEQRTAQQKSLVDYYGKNWFSSYYLSGWDSAHPNATPEERQKALANFQNKVGEYDNFADAVAATRKGANDYYTKALLAAYDASDIGEDGEAPAEGSGGGGGDDKDDDKDKGTKKERVDLVLCNKKEIPKLNVNLFKKAPQFTVLNKNFKLRDIKINTQDKPKAVLDSLKNAIIDTQKRMDPKIIQDEEAEYDPVAATDGNNTPSGSTSTTTDD